MPMSAQCPLIPRLPTYPSAAANGRNGPMERSGRLKAVKMKPGRLAESPITWRAPPRRGLSRTFRIVKAVKAEPRWQREFCPGPQRRARGCKSPAHTIDRFHEWRVHRETSPYRRRVQINAQRQCPVRKATARRDVKVLAKTFRNECGRLPERASNSSIRHSR